jgi:hypothetical protein
MLDFDLVRIRKLSPATAGFISDWSIRPREITTTFVDLLIKGYIYGNSEKVYLVENMGAPEKLFEIRFLSAVFADSKSISYDHLSDILFRKKYSILSSIIFKGCLEEGIIERNSLNTYTVS